MQQRASATLPGRDVPFTSSQLLTTLALPAKKLSGGLRQQ